MTVAETLAKANLFVITRETKYLEYLNKKTDKMKTDKTSIYDYGCHLCVVEDELKRMKEDGAYDEEEWMLGNLANKKK